jgi:hypothetical protein
MEQALEHSLDYCIDTQETDYHVDSLEQQLNQVT